jgi:hypothetical protein
VEISARTQSVLLLTASFSRSVQRDAQPLTPEEWGRLANSLSKNGLTPEDLLDKNTEEFSKILSESGISLERTISLLGRSSALGLALERWLRIGIWIINRSDPEYPARLKQCLKAASPPVLYGCGDKNLLLRRSISIVGSKKSTADEVSFACELARLAAFRGMCVISILADNHIEDAAVKSALETGGIAMILIAGGLFQRTLNAKYRDHLMSGHLVLVSPFSPEIGYNGKNLRTVENCRYSLAQAAIVVGNLTNKDIGWGSLTENLRNRWAPVWVGGEVSLLSKTAELIKLGAQRLPDILKETDMESLFVSKENLNLFDENRH